MSTTATKERPILFSGEMVKAILDGRKTQTRRVVKLRDPTATYSCFDDEGWPLSADEYGQWNKDLCPYGQPGDRLWVRETHRETFDIDNRPVMEYRAGGTRLIVGESVQHGEHRATSILPKWKPSIFMPRWASRITLEITDVRVERLNEISEADALAEGVANDRQRDSTWYEGKSVDLFRELWSKINGPDSWTANPWVYAITFRRLTP